MTNKKETAVAVPLDKEIIAHEEHEVNEKLDIDLWIKTRQEFKNKIGSIMVEGSDYHIIQGKKSLAKGGAEKIASIWKWTAEFVKDTETLEMIGDVKGTLCYICNLTKNGELQGQGRGAANLVKNGGDVNKTIKMAQKSAFIDAVLRASGLSDIYAQDLEDMPHDQISKPVHKSTIPASQAQMKLIGDLVKQKNITREDIIDAGFDGDARKLTGGKDGTAAELIKWLFEQQTKDNEQLPIIEQEKVSVEEVDKW